MAHFTKTSPSNFSLLDKEIHIWRVNLDLLSPNISGFYNTLSFDEKTRSARYHFAQDSDHFIIRRGVLRKILSSYLDIQPNCLQFCYGKNGKPALIDAFNVKNIHFNLSHSRGIALFAFTRGFEIGVDIEYIDDIPEMEQIAEQFFSGRENAVFRALPEWKKKEAFFNCWTCKEAFIKAIGEGLTMLLDKFDVSLVPGEPARLLRIEEDSKQASRWSILELKPASGFAAALAIQGRARRFHCLNWPV